MNQPLPGKNWTNKLPFPRHWLIYIALKIIVLALAVWLGLKWYGVV